MASRVGFLLIVLYCVLGEGSDIGATGDLFVGRSDRGLGAVVDNSLLFINLLRGLAEPATEYRDFHKYAERPEKMST